MPEARALRRYDMHEFEYDTTESPSREKVCAWSRMCAAALALSLCFTSIVPTSAGAVDDPSETGSSEESTVSAGEEEPEDSESVVEGSDSETESDAADDPDAEATIEGSDDVNADTESDQQQSEEVASDDSISGSDDDQDDEFVIGTDEARGESDSKSSAHKLAVDDADKDGTVERDEMTPEEEALDKLGQAEAIYAQMSRAETDMAESQAELEKLEKSEDDTSALGKETRAALKKQKKRLAKLQEKMSDFIVESYKRGGVTPYLDALFRTTSYKEFLTAWYMLDEVASYGRDELHSQTEAVAKLQSEVDELDAKAEKAKKKVENAEAKANRAKLTYYSLAPHAASLKMEAARLLKDAQGYEDARAEYDQANAALQEVLDQDLAGATRLEGEGIFTNPCPDATYSSGFGYRDFDHAYHMGLDMAISEGTPYYAAESGEVIASTNGGGYNGGAGNWIVIDHGNGVVTKYMHSSVTFVEAGDKVVRGQNIGLVGNTGNSFGAHLHFQVELDGVPVDPIIYL